MSNILIYQVSYGAPEPEYVSLSSKINKQYAASHGYDYKEFKLDESFPRHPAWGRVWHLREQLPNYDYVLYVDGDAFVVNQSMNLGPLTGYIKDPNVCGLFARDQMLESSVFHSDRANAGVFLFSRGNNGIELADKWWNVPEDPSYGGTFYDTYRYLDNSDSLYHHPYEQLALWFLWESNTRSFRFVKSYKELNGLDGTFIRHLIKVPDKERVRILHGYIKQ